MLCCVRQPQVWRAVAGSSVQEGCIGAWGGDQRPRRRQPGGEVPGTQSRAAHYVRGGHC